MKQDSDGPLQDPVNLTPFDLYWAGIIIEEPMPNYYRYLRVDNGKKGALHDTPKQAIASARKCFGVWEDNE